MKKLIGILILLFAFTSCLEVKQKTYLKELDQLTEEVDSLTTVYQSFSGDDAQKVIDSRTILFNDFISKTQEIDTIDITTAQHIENIKYSIKNLEQFIQHYQPEKKNLEDKSKELQHLTYIVKNGYGKRGEYPNMIQNESENVARLKRNIMELDRCYKEGMQDFDESVRYIRNLIEE